MAEIRKLNLQRIIVQMLLDCDYGAVGVAIDSGPAADIMEDSKASLAGLVVYVLFEGTTEMDGRKLGVLGSIILTETLSGAGEPGISGSWTARAVWLLPWWSLCGFCVPIGRCRCRICLGWSISRMLFIRCVRRGACNEPSSTPAIGAWQTIFLFRPARVLSTRRAACPRVNQAVTEPGIDIARRATHCFEGIHVRPEVHEFAGNNRRGHARAAQRDDRSTCGTGSKHASKCVAILGHGREVRAEPRQSRPAR